MTVSRQLADFASACSYADAPASTQRAVSRMLLNAVALAVEAADRPAAAIALATAREAGTPPTTRLLGRPERVGVLAAALVTGIAVHSEDFDDTHLPTVLHPSAPIIPAALAAGQLGKASAETLLSGILAGTEVAIRVATGLCPEHFDRGWHVTSTIGHLGAAVAAGRVLGLGPDQMLTALSLGTTQAGGLTAALGTMTKPFHPGKAAADGVEAGLLAARGFTAPAAPIEGRRGLAALAQTAADTDAMVQDLGSRWLTEDNTIKAYACGVVSHAVIDAGIRLRQRLDGAPPAAVGLAVNPVVLEVMGIETPADGLESKFSVRHCFAVGLLDGAAGLDQFTDERARSEDVAAVRDIVQVTPDSAVPKGAALATVRTAGESELREEVRHATGSLERPLSDTELRQKALDLVSRRLGARGAAELVDRCLSLHGQATLEPLFDVATPQEATLA